MSAAHQSVPCLGIPFSFASYPRSATSVGGEGQGRDYYLVETTHLYERSYLSIGPSVPFAEEKRRVIKRGKSVVEKRLFFWEEGKIEGTGKRESFRWGSWKQREVQSHRGGQGGRREQKKRRDGLSFGYGGGVGKADNGRRGKDSHLELWQ